MLMGKISQSADITNLGQWIGGSLQKQQLGIGLNRLFPLIQFRQCDVGDLHAKLHHKLVEEHHSGPEDATRDHHMISRLEYPHTGSEDCRHPG